MNIDQKQPASLGILELGTLGCGGSLSGVRDMHGFIKDRWETRKNVTVMYKAEKVIALRMVKFSMMLMLGIKFSANSTGICRLILCKN